MSWLSFLGQRGNGDPPDDRDPSAEDPGSAAPRDPSRADPPATDVPSSGDGASASPAARDGVDDGPWNFEALTPAPPAPAAAGASVVVGDPLKTLELKPHVIEALSTVFDPEIPVNIYELGLIYDVIIDAEARVQVKMTLTSPACPAAQQLPGEVQDKVRRVPGVSAAGVEIVWDPPWSPERMSDVARLQLGFF